MMVLCVMFYMVRGGVSHTKSTWFYKNPKSLAKFFNFRPNNLTMTKEGFLSYRFISPVKLSIMYKDLIKRFLHVTGLKILGKF